MKNAIKIGFAAIITAVALLIIFVGASILFNTWETYEVEYKAIGWMFAGIGVLLVPVFAGVTLYGIFNDDTK